MPFVFQEQLALVKQHVVSGWRIHQCTNCEMLTHATYGADGHNKLLINLSLKVVYLPCTLLKSFHIWSIAGHEEPSPFGSIKAGMKCTA